MSTQIRGPILVLLAGTFAAEPRSIQSYLWQSHHLLCEHIFDERTLRLIKVLHVPEEHVQLRELVLEKLPLALLALRSERGRNVVHLHAVVHFEDLKGRLDAMVPDVNTRAPRANLQNLGLVLFIHGQKAEPQLASCLCLRYLHCMSRQQCNAKSKRTKNKTKNPMGKYGMPAHAQR